MEFESRLKRDFGHRRAAGSRTKESRMEPKGGGSTRALAVETGATAEAGVTAGGKFWRAEVFLLL